jgi:hypothetical protein
VPYEPTAAKDYDGYYYAMAVDGHRANLPPTTDVEYMSAPRYHENHFLKCFKMIHLFTSNSTTLHIRHKQQRPVLKTKLCSGTAKPDLSLRKM